MLNCGRQLSATAKFCPACAHPTGLPATAPAAQRFSSPDSYTPRHLAERILTSKAAVEGERKQVTVLFCDLANSTALAERLGPEAIHGCPKPILRVELGRGPPLRGHDQPVPW